MEIQVIQAKVAEIETEALCLGIFEGVTSPGGAAGAIDEALNGALSLLLSDGDFRGKEGETYFLRMNGSIKPKRLLLIGLGNQEDFSVEVVRRISARAAQAASDLGELTSILHGAGIGGLEPESATQAMVEGTLLGAYAFNKFKADPGQGVISKFQIVELDENKLSAIQLGVETAKAIANGVAFARDLANEPGDSLPPIELAKRAQAMAESSGLSCEILDEDAIDREKLAGILGVARGSAQLPRLIVLEHKPANSQGKVVLVGKGVTFDSGGISIKPRAGMEKMKFDMGGAAAVIGTMQVVASLKLPIHVICIVPAVENLPSSTALKPGDVLRYKNGKSVEVTNTDAEGRLILADGLLYAKRYEPDYVIDVATLTGACVVALGDAAAGIFSDEDELVDQLRSAGEAASERLWRLPLYPEYKKLLKSQTADFGNSVMAPGGSPQAASSVAAIFLKEFVDFPWAHLDIAGVAWDLKKAYCPAGASGYGVRLLTQFLRDRVS
jgi:leucyl aminopeptidase